jgi:oligogalacturonide lyase
MGPVSRRSLLISGWAASRLSAEASRFAPFDSDWRRYADPATELTVYRLTDSAYSSTLPAYYNRSIPRRGGLLLFCCDRTGSPQPFRMDLKNGQTAQIGEAEDLDGRTLSLTPDGRAAAYFAGRTLRLLTLASHREHALYGIADGWERCAGASLSADGLAALFAERQGGASRLRSASLARPVARTVVQAKFEITHPIARPLRSQILYRNADRELWLVNSDGRQNRKLKLADGRIGPANWSVDGRLLLYLRIPDDPRQLAEIREFTPESGVDKLVAKTSQFVHFGFNRDTSVFVGASRNAASPTVLLLLRVTRREFTLCEHKSSKPETTAPMFSPDAQRIYFESDRHGKPAIYSMNVEKLVEKIGSET